MLRIRYVRWSIVLLIAILVGCVTEAPPDLANIEPSSIPTNDPVSSPTIQPTSMKEPGPTNTSVQIQATPTENLHNEHVPGIVTDSNAEQIDSIRNKLLSLVKEDLAKKLSISVEQIKLINTEPVAWPDANLGCRQSDVVDNQSPIFGFRVILEADGKLYEYHTDLNQSVVLCEQVLDESIEAPLPEISSPPSEESPIFGQQVEQAKADLAQRLGVDLGSITVVRTVDVTWPDGSLGCPQPDMAYTQVLVDGSFIQLSVQGRTYNYHSGRGGTPVLCQSKNEILPEDLPDDGSGFGDI